MAYMNKLRQTFNPVFNRSTDEWLLKITIASGKEVRIPLILAKELAPGGAFIRHERYKYREWLLGQQKGLCAVCGQAITGKGELDHQPPLGQPGAKFIDYEKKTPNRVVHKKCHTRNSSTRSGLKGL